MPSNATHRIAIYDMDKTITVAPTWTGFLIGAARAYAPWRLALLPVAGLAVGAYGLKLLDRARLKQVTQRLLIGGTMSSEDAADAAARFADRIIAQGLFAGARTRIEADRAAGYRLVMATASYHFYVTAIAERLGFDAVIATGSRKTADGRLRALIDGENCYGPAKLRMIKAWLAAQGIERADAEIRFYSDHVSDAPTLDWADTAFAVHPHGPLRTLATARGWAILDW
ncbi:MAG: HAD-IB family hydrolase [Pseudomonadota bacterium]|uniref:HAD family hydrolase n=1 Tax=Sphingomonas sp. ERG5 TaxID=1381597 RepID=UPI000B0B37A0|nr:HAD-IB family hydrolase [Sphingomonas sp. ERG5]